MGSSPSKGLLPSPAADGTEALILVVGNDTKCKTRVAHALAKALGATNYEVTKAGVRIFTRESKEPFPPQVVMDTVPLRMAEGWLPVDTARVWISQNSLRKLFGKLVFVVCVVSPTDPKDQIYQEPGLEWSSFSWLHLLACIFEKHKQEMMILVNSEDSTDEASRLKLREVLTRDGFVRRENITFASLRNGVDLTPTINTVLRLSVRRSFFDEETTIESKSAVAPFLLPEVARNASDRERFGPWGPESMIVFGRSGSGKSTLAQMLTLGRLDASCKKFSTSSSIRGETRTVSVGQGRGWRVIDTPGLGQRNDDSKSTISTDKAARLILNHVLLVEGTYCHFIYVWKKSRVDNIDPTLWRVFVKVVGADLIQNHATVVVSDADQDWLDGNVSRLKECFGGCESFLTVDFPPIAADDGAYEKELQEIRMESLKALEDELASLCRLDTSCKLGMWSTGTQRRMMKTRGNESLLIVKPAIRQTAAFGPSAAEVLHPSDYETARTYIRLNSTASWMASVLVPSKKLDLRNESLSSPDLNLRSRTTGPLMPSANKSLGLEPRTEAPTTHGTLLPTHTEDFNDAKGKGEGLKFDPEVLASQALRIDCTDDFAREIKERGEDGYFVSSRWLLNLGEHERRSLVLVLCRAGYSEAYQTATTTLFARIENDGQYQNPSTDAPQKIVYLGDIDEVGAPQGDNDPLEIAGKDLNIDKKADIAHAFYSDNPAETSSSSDGGRTLEEEISPAVGEERPATVKSSKAALESRNHQSFCVSTQWLSTLKANEKEALEAGYEKIRQTKTTILYEKIQGHVKNPARDAHDDNSSSSSNRNDIAGGDVKKHGTSKRGGFLGLWRRSRNVDMQDNKSGSSSVANTVETSRIQSGDSTCHPQLLSVDCSSPPHISRELSRIGDFIRKQFGDLVVTMPGADESKIISTTIEKPFSVTELTILSDGRGREVPINLKAIASSALSCCLRIDHHEPKVRIKFSRISVEVKNEESEEEMCNAMVLSSLYTTVYGCIQGTHRSEQITLHLDDEYYKPPRRRVLASTQRLSGDSATTSGDLVWLEISGSTAHNCEPCPTTLRLRGDNKGRRTDESQSQVQLAEPLLFQERRPVIFEGDLEHSYIDPYFFKFHIRYRLDVSYFKLCTPLSEGPVWRANHVTKAIDFDCCLEIRTKRFRVTSDAFLPEIAMY